MGPFYVIEITMSVNCTHKSTTKYSQQPPQPREEGPRPPPAVAETRLIQQIRIGQGTTEASQPLEQTTLDSGLDGSAYSYGNYQQLSIFHSTSGGSRSPYDIG